MSFSTNFTVFSGRAPNNLLSSALHFSTKSWWIVTSFVPSVSAVSKTFGFSFTNLSQAPLTFNPRAWTVGSCSTAFWGCLIPPTKATFLGRADLALLSRTAPYLPCPPTQVYELEASWGLFLVKMELFLWWCFLWWCFLWWWFFCGDVFCDGVLWWCFLWWCFCGGVLVVVFLWWCSCGGVFAVGVLVVVFCVFVVVFLCFCAGVVVFLWWCSGVFVVVWWCFLWWCFLWWFFFVVVFFVVVFFVVVFFVVVFFCGGVVVFLWCFCCGVFVAVFFVVVWLCFWCVFVVVLYTCDNVRFQSATQWTASVHTLHMSKPW